MVSPGDRMRKLQSLLNIRLGPGAAKLPPAVTKLHLALGEGIIPGGKGAKIFWREYLPRLKYHNPSIPITVHRHADTTLPSTLLIHLSKPGNSPIIEELEITKKNEKEILATLIEKVGGAEKIEPTLDELEVLERLEGIKTRGMKDSLESMRMRARVKKERDMLEQASQGAI